MQCPYCHHVSSVTRLKCRSCGQSYERATLETLQHLQYTLAWLDERAAVLGPEAHQQLRDEAQGQLDALRDELGITPPRELKEIARELALVQVARDETKCWAAAFALTPGAARVLRRYLSQQIEELEAELAGRPASCWLGKDLHVLEFALQSLPSWAENAPLRPASADILRQHLQQERDALLQSLAPPPALAPQPAPSVHSAEPRSRWPLYGGAFLVVVGMALQGNVSVAVVGLVLAALLAAWSRWRATNTNDDN